MLSHEPLLILRSTPTYGSGPDGEYKGPLIQGDVILPIREIEGISDYTQVLSRLGLVKVFRSDILGSKNVRRL